MTGFNRFTPLVQSLPASVPFVGPETSERASGMLFKARIGANENGFGFHHLFKKQLKKKRIYLGAMETRKALILKASSATH